MTAVAMALPRVASFLGISTFELQAQIASVLGISASEVMNIDMTKLVTALIALGLTEAVNYVNQLVGAIDLVGGDVSIDDFQEGDDTTTTIPSVSLPTWSNTETEEVSSISDSLPTTNEDTGSLPVDTPIDNILPVDIPTTSESATSNVSSETLIDVMRANTQAIINSVDNLSKTITLSSQYLANVIANAISAINVTPSVSVAPPQVNVTNEVQTPSVSVTNEVTPSINVSSSGDAVLSVDMSGVESRLRDITQTLSALQTIANSKEIEKSYYESLTTQTEIKDLDGNVIANAKPVEIEAMKNAIIVRAKTDEINYELDEDDIELLQGFDFTKLDYETFASSLEELNNG